MKIKIKTNKRVAFLDRFGKYNHHQPPKILIINGREFKLTKNGVIFAFGEYDWYQSTKITPQEFDRMYSKAMIEGIKNDND